MVEELKIITCNMGDEGQREIDTALERGAYESLKKVLGGWTPSQVIDEIKKSGLRGRGGAGFPTGLKWSFVPVNSARPKYLCCNADEGEPGTFKDRYIMERDPHLLVEGMAIACFAIGIRYSYIYIRGEFVKQARILDEAVNEAYAKGLLGKNILGSGFACDVTVHRGAGAYICGEETGLIESLEGKRGMPRLKPPFPAIVGLFDGPTVVNNVETLANVPRIIEKGSEWFAAIGTENNGGTRLFGVSGHVNRPGIFELPLGTPLRDIMELAGGVRDGGKLKAVIPGGSSAPVLTPDEIEVPMDFDSLAKIGTMAGSGGIIVMDDSVSMVKIAGRLLDFYAHESCGQCTPCREGVAWMARIMRRILAGEGRSGDIDLILRTCDNIKGRTICPLGDAAAMPTEGFLKKFRSEFEEMIH